MDIIDATFSSIEQFEPLDRYTTLYTSLDQQLQYGLMNQIESDRTRYIVRKLWELKLQIHMIEKEDVQPSDALDILSR